MTRAKKKILRLGSLAALSATLLVGQRAGACGGFFCSRTPVDQTAERIIFTVNADATVTAYIQIAYSGERDDFAWILPVPAQPTLDVGFPQLAIQGLDLATEPQYTQFSCPGLNFAFGGDNSGGVTVLAEEVVGPFQTATIEGTSADVLVAWLQDNGYRINDSMVPVIQPYVDESMKFVAMKLTAESDVDDIEPIVMTYESSRPMIPIRLTSVAAQPEMGVVAWVLADQRYGPDNYVDLEISDELIEFDVYGFRNNYLTVVSQEVDKVGGHAFVTEYAKPTAELITRFENAPVPSDNPEAVEANEAILALLGRFAYITRLYTRISAEEMKVDPYFAPSSDPTDVDNVHDLTDTSPDAAVCDAPVPCTFTYCGRWGVCVESLDGNDACVCADAATARPTTTGGGELGLYCEPLTVNFVATNGGALGTGPDFGDACASFDCGAHGECITMNGNPTCVCEPGFGAVAFQEPDPTTGAPLSRVSCEEVGEDIPTLPPLPPIGEPDGPVGEPVASDPGTDPLAGEPAGDPPPGDEPAGDLPPGGDPGQASGGGCGCRAAGSTKRSPFGVVAIMALAAGALLRRRR